jgi:hypothetical protein
MQVEVYVGVAPVEDAERLRQADCRRAFDGAKAERPTGSAVVNRVARFLREVEQAVGIFE